MDIERRNKGKQSLENSNEVLNDSQLLALNKMEGFGWVLAFIRKPLFQNIVPVLFHPDSKKLAILDNDGALNIKPDIKFR